MTKRRMIHDCIWQSESFSALTYRQRLLWIGLITTADDQGRGRAHPGLIRAAVFPYDVISQDEIQDDLDAIGAAGMVLIYQVDDKLYYQVLNWWEYQTPQWVGPSDFPAPADWEDRLRYHGKERRIITQNWPNTPDTTPDDKGSDKGRDKASPEALAGGKGKGKGKEEVKEEEDTRAFLALLSRWSELFPEKTQPRPNNIKLREKAVTRMGETDFRENWEAALVRASRSSFCNESGWFQLSWFLYNGENWEKCLNGNYDDKPKRAAGPPVRKQKFVTVDGEFDNLGDDMIAFQMRQRETLAALKVAQEEGGNGNGKH
jgi:hypothetical protein